MRRLRVDALRHPAVWLVVLVSAGIAVYYTVPGDMDQRVTYLATELVAVLAIPYGVYLYRPRERLAWILLAAGNAVTLAGEAAYEAEALLIGGEPDSPNVSDGLYLSAYPFLIAALILFARRPAHGLSRGLVDAGIVTVGVSVPVWLFILRPAIDGGVLEGSELAVLVAYPALDLALLGTLAAVVMTTLGRSRAFVLLGAATLFLVLTDALYVRSWATGYTIRSWIDAGWLIAAGLYGLAALDPSMRQLTVGAARRERAVPVFRFLLLAAAALLTPALLIAQAVGDRGFLAEVLLAAFAFLLLIVRLSLLVSEVERARRDEELARAEAESAERLLAEQNERLRELDRAKDEFISLVSHDLRTPLTSIKGYLELLVDEEAGVGPVNEEQRRFLETIDRNADRLLAMVNDLLFVARLEAGREALALRDVDLSALAHKSVEMVRPAAEGRGLELTYSIEDGVSATADEERISRVLENLLSNALKFTNDGGRVEVRLRRVGEEAMLEVADTGIGIPSDERERLFQRFFRAEAARHIPGTGLGLYMTKRMVDAHGGRVSVESEVGAGSTFRVELPLAGPQSVFAHAAPGREAAALEAA